MPRFTTLDQRITLNIPNDSTRADASVFGGDVAKANRERGGAISNFGGAVGEVSKYLRDRQDHNDLTKAKQDGSKALLDVIKEVGQSRLTASPDGSGHADAVQKIIKDRFESLKKQYSSPLAAEYISSLENQVTRHTVGQEVHYQAALFADNLKNTEIQISNDETSLLINDPSQLSITKDVSRQRIDGYRFNPKSHTGISDAEVVTFQRDNIEKLTAAATEGRIVNSTSKADAETVLESLKKDKTLIRDLKPNDLLRLEKAAQVKINHLTNEGKVELASARASLTNDARDYIASVTDGNIEKRPPQLSDDNIRQIFKPEQADKLIENIHLFESAPEKFNIVNTGSRDEVRSFLNKEDDALKTGGSENYRSRKTLHDALMRTNAAREMALSEYPATYAASHSDLLKKKSELISNTENPDEKFRLSKDFTNALIEEERRLLGPNANDSQISALTKTQIDYYKGLFNEYTTESGKTLDNAVEALKEATGVHFGRAVRDLYKNHAAPIGLSLISQLPNPEDRKVTSEALKNYKLNLKHLKETVPDFKETDISYEVGSKLSDYFSSLSSLTSTGVIMDKHDIQAGLTALAVRNTVAGINDPVDSAVKTFTNQFTFYNSPNGVKIRIPNDKPVDRKNFVYTLDALRINLAKNYADKIDVGKVYSLHNQPGKEVQVDLAEKQDVLKKGIESGNIHFVTANDNSGLMLINNNGAYMPTKSGQPFIIKWEELPVVVYTGEELKAMYTTGKQ